MAEETRIAAPEVSREVVLQKCDYFVDVNLWPRSERLSPEQWLQNFTVSELPYAVQLLNSFMYFSDDLVDQMFTAAFQKLSGSLTSGARNPAEAHEKWQRFMDSAMFSIVKGEVPSIADSGYVFARKARQRLGISEANILDNDQLVARLASTGPCPVILVDDFVGSGQQFIETWEREWPLRHSSPLSLKQLSTRFGSAFFYCPVLVTEYGMDRIRHACANVVISPGNILSARHSVFHPQSLIWPESLKAGVRAFVASASERAGIPQSEQEGFHKLGLAVAIRDTVPDASLPLFYWQENGWKSLVRRA